MNNELNLYAFHEFLESSISTIVDKIGIPKTVIEIGVFQGYFTFNMTSLAVTSVPSYKHYAIDPFTSSPDLSNDVIENAFKVFQQNLINFSYSNHIEFIRKKSWNGLIDLINRGVKADLIYIDGDHMASTVLKDLVLGYELLNINGVMLCDDSVAWVHTEKNGLKPNDYSPKLAVDSFIHCNWNKIEPIILPNGWQTAFIKRAE